MGFFCLLIFYCLSSFTHAAVVADYRFNDSTWLGKTPDLSGNDLDANIVSNTQITGKNCEASNSTSTTSYLNVPYSAAVGTKFGLTAAYTIASWVKFDGTGVILQRHSGTSGYSFEIGNQSGLAKLRLRINGNFYQDSAGPIPPMLPFNTWHHVAVTVSGTSATFYLNGSAVTTTAVIATSNPIGYGVTIGQKGSTGTYFSVDDTMMFDTALSGAQILAGYNNLVAGKTWDGAVSACTGQKVVDYRFEDNFNDSSGNGLTAVGIGQFFSTGRICKAAWMVGNGRSLFVPENPLLRIAGDFTITAWMRNPVTAVGYIAGKFTASDGFVFSVDANGRLTGFNGTSWVVSAGAKVTDGYWHHVAMSVSGTSVKFYVDGQLNGSGTFSGITKPNSTSGFSMGMNNLNGVLDEVQVFDYALSQTKINAGYLNQRNGFNWDGTALSCSNSSVAWLYNSGYHQITQNGKTATVTVSATTTMAYVAAGGWYSPAASFGTLNPANGFKNTNANSVTLSSDRPLIDPHIAIYSLGSPSLAASMTFDQPFELVVNGPDDYAITNNTTYACTVSGNTITGQECGAILKFKGVYTKLSFTNTAENWTGFNLGAAQVADNAVLDGYYRFEDSTAWNGTAGELKDSSGNDHHGYAWGSSTLPKKNASDPVIANSGTCAYAEFPTAAANTSGAFSAPGLSVSTVAGEQTTVSFWMYWNGIEWEHPVGWGSTSSTYSLWMSAGVLTFSSHNSSDRYGAVVPVQTTVNKWTHVVAIFTNNDYSRNKIYINGVEQFLFQWGGTPRATPYSVDSQFNIGAAYKNGGDRFTGRLDEVKVYKGVLTNNQILALQTEKHNCESGINGQLVAQYRFEEPNAWNGTAGEVKDTANYTGGPFNGVAAGTAKPTRSSSFPALPLDANNSGTCTYTTTTSTGKLNVTGLPLSTVADAKTSVSFWMYWNGSTFLDRIAINFGSVVYGLMFSGNFFGFTTSGGDVRGVLWPSTTTTGWYHVVAVFNNGTSTTNKLYINGVERSLSLFMGSVTNRTMNGAMVIGASNTSHYFNNRLDEVKVFNGELSLNDAKLLYAERHKCYADNPVLLGEYRFEELIWTGATGELKDSSGNGRNGKAIGNVLPYPGVSNPARKNTNGTSGTCGYANLSGPLWDSASFQIDNLPVSTLTGAKTSVSFWLYWDGQDRMPIGWTTYDLALQGNTIGFNTANNDIYGFSAANLANGWHHIVAVFTNGSVSSNKIYVDGVNKSLSLQPGYMGNYSPSSNANAVVSSSFYVGGWGNNTGHRLSGRIDEVKIYHGELSQTDVTALYSEDHACPPSTPATQIAQYRFEETSWNGTAGELKDSAGYATGPFNGKAAGIVSLPSPATATPAKPGQSGTCGYANMPGDYTNGGAFDIMSIAPIGTQVNGLQVTVSFWVYWNGIDNRIMIGWGDLYNLQFLSGSVGFNTSNSDIYGISSVGLANGWHHIVAVFTNQDPYQNRLYIDGVAKQLTQRTGYTKPRTIYGTLRIGGSPNTNDNRFGGYIDEVKVFKGAVTAEQVQQLYSETHNCSPAPIAEYHFEDYGWSGVANELQDSSGNNKHGTFSGTPLPTQGTASPARAGTAGTCGYVTFNGDRNRTGSFSAANLPINQTAGGKNTVSFWMKANNSWAEMAVALGTYNIETHYDGTNFRMGFNTWGDDFYSVTRSDIVGQWRHIVAVFANNAPLQNKLYINGVLQTLANTGNNTLQNMTAGTTLYIGSGHYAGYRFTGELDEVKVFNYELSPSQIDDLYNEIHPCIAEPIAKYHFEDSLWNGTAGELNDSATYAGGPFNGQAIGSPLPTKNTALPARAGTCAYATLPAPISGGGAFDVLGLPTVTTAGAKTSVSAWLKWNGSNSVMPFGWAGHDIYFISGYVGFNGANSDLYGISSSGFAGVWKHVVAVFNNGDMTKNKLYVNGVAQNLSQLLTSPGNSTVSSGLRIGGWYPGVFTTGAIDYRGFGDIDELQVFNKELTLSEVNALYNETHSCSGSIHHIRIEHTGSAVTCSPPTVILQACAGGDQPGGCVGDTTGVSGYLVATSTDGTILAKVPFVIPIGASMVKVALPVTSPQIAVLSVSDLSVTPSNSHTCWLGNTADCRLNFSDSGFLLSLNNSVQYADLAQTLTVSAVRTSDNGKVCVPAFQNINKNVNFKCSYINPIIGTLPVVLNGNSFTCGIGSLGSNITLGFNNDGDTFPSLSYADVGKILLTATYQAAGNDGGLTMKGTKEFFSVPKSFSVVIDTAAPIKAGTNFQATVRALSYSGSVTPNFGNESIPETVIVTHSKIEPTGGGSSSGLFNNGLGSFVSGIATGNTFQWSEVGKIQVKAKLTNPLGYLNTGAITDEGVSAVSGAFIPYRFETSVTHACGSGFTYSGQPFALKVTAKNAQGIKTNNYDGTINMTASHGKSVNISDVVGTAGSFATTSIAADKFVLGEANDTATFTFTNIQTIPNPIVIRANNVDGVTSNVTPVVEGSTNIYSGRAKLANANGIVSLDLPTKLRLEYWSLANRWAENNADTCTTFSNTNFAFTFPTGTTNSPNNLAACESKLTVSGTSPNFTLTLSKPGANNYGWTDMTLNLGTASAGVSCTAVGGPGGAETSANKPWLQFPWKSPTKSNPTARMNFGSGKTWDSRVIFQREAY